VQVRRGLPWRPITESVARGSAVGRDGELRQLDACRATAGTALGVVAIEGEAGIGRTGRSSSQQSPFPKNP